jgi:hypothetical protein
MRYIVEKAVRNRIRLAGKQISPEALDILDGEVEKLIQRAVRNSRGFRRIQAGDFAACGIPARQVILP